VLHCNFTCPVHAGTQPASSKSIRTDSARMTARNAVRALTFPLLLAFLSLCVPAYGSGTRRFTTNLTSISFGTVALNALSSQSLQITSTGTGPIKIETIAASGLGFSVQGTTLPIRLQPGQTLSVQVQFKPTVSGISSGSVIITTNSFKEPSLTIPLSGTGATGSPILTLSATSLNFPDSPGGTPQTQAITLSSTGTAPVTVNSATISGAGFSMSGATFPVTLNPGIAISVQIQFQPTAAGTFNGSVTFSSNSTTGSTSQVTLVGVRTLLQQLTLSWTPPASSPVPVVGYNVYRAISGSSSFQLLNSTTDAQTTYSDQGVESGLSYTYYVESVDQSGDTSVPSAQLTVAIP
jgi:hypothetical protein